MYNPSFLPGSRTNRQDSRFARLRRPEGSGQGWSECIQSQGRETRICQSCLIRHLCTDKLPSMALDSGSPCRNDGVLAIMRIAEPELARASGHFRQPNQPIGIIPP